MVHVNMTIIPSLLVVRIRNAKVNSTNSIVRITSNRLFWVV